MSNEPYMMAARQESRNDCDVVTVFVVDDHAGYRSLVGEVIAATAGFAVAGKATSWAAAQTALEQMANPPHMVLMDVNLGHESGVAAASELRARWPEVKVVLISTLDLADLPDHARHCGASAFLPKSELSPRELLRAWRGDYDWSASA